MRAASVSFTLLVLGTFVAPAAAQAHIAWEGLHDSNAVATQRSNVIAIAPHPGGGVVALVRSYESQFNPYWYTSRADVVRWSESGQKLWVRSLPNTPVVPSGAIDVDGQGNSFALIWSQFGAQRVFALDASGAITWSQQLPGISGRGIRRMPAGDVVVAGSSPWPNTDIRVCSLSAATGSISWTTTIPGPAGDNDDGESVAFDSAGNVFVVGEFRIPSSIPGGPFTGEIALVKLNSAGQLQWAVSDPSTNSTSTYGTEIAVAPGGDVILGGRFVNTTWSAGPAYVARFDTHGVRLWNRTFMLPPSSITYPMDLVIAPNDGVWVLVTRMEGFQDLGLLHYDAAGGVLAEVVDDPPGNESTRPLGIALGSAGQVWTTAHRRFVQAGPTGITETALLEFDHAASVDWSLSFDSSLPYGFEEWNHSVLTTGKQLVLAGATGNSGGDLALVIAFDISEAPDAYCTGKTNSQGCVPALGFSGLSSAAQTSGFVVVCSSALNRKPGTMLYSVGGDAATPFQGGTLCLAPPVRRTPPQDSGGTPLPAQDCSGAYALDFNAFAHGLAGGSPAPELLVPGTRVWTQTWARDPGIAPPNNSSLSNGLSFVVLP